MVRWHRAHQRLQKEAIQIAQATTIASSLGGLAQQPQQNEYVDIDKAIPLDEYDDEDYG